MFDSLNTAQRRAAVHGDGPLLVIAGAGSGKTLTLACRVAALLERGVPPQRILLLTFSRRASKEMLARAERMRGDGAAGRIWGGTFHAVANRLLRMAGRPLELRPDFTVLDQADAADTMNLLRNELGYGTGERRFPRKDTLAAIYSRTVNAGDKLSRVVRDSYPWCTDELDGIKAVFSAYTARKRRANVLDYDDLLLFWRELATSPETGSALANSFDHILVDEYQDTNSIQAEILRAMRPPGSSLTVVGDDAQAIYGFRAATVRNILDFPHDFAGTTVVRLEQNYRSTPPILAASNAVIALSPQRHDKTLWSRRDGELLPMLRTSLDEAEQSVAVCTAVLERRERGTPLKRQAVLFRAGHHSDLLEVELARRNIPFVKYGGLKFMEAAHVKDVLALLRVLENPRDEIGWFRVLLLLEGVGPATAGRLMDALGVRDPDPANGSAVRRLIEEPPAVPIGAQRGFDELRDAIADCVRAAPDRVEASDDDAGAGASALGPAAQIERLRRFCEPVFRRTYDAAEARLRDIDQLEQLAAGSADRSSFLAELTLDPPTSTGDLAGPPLLDEDWLVLSTIHSAKGLEWDAVHIIHAADGMIPSDMATGDDEAIEEERRLLYVAMTRARDELVVHFPQRYYRRPRGLEDPHSFAQLTRFLTPEVRAAFREAGPSAPAGPAATGLIPSATGASRVDALLSDLWD